MKLLFAAALALAPLAALAEPISHFVAIHVDENDPQVMTMALNNARNIADHYAALEEIVVIEIVAYGPGLHMMRADTSPVAGRIAALSLEHDNLSFSACGNTHRAMSNAVGHDVKLLDEAALVPSGAARLIELQEMGYAYIRP